MNYKGDLPLERLRVTVRRPNVRKRVYSNTTLPEELKPYVEKAIEELRTSGDPTISREYPLDQDSTMSVWFKPVYIRVYHEPEGWPYNFGGREPPKPRMIRIRVWP